MSIHPQDDIEELITTELPRNGKKQKMVDGKARERRRRIGARLTVACYLKSRRKETTGYLGMRCYFLWSPSNNRLF